jgi:dephospho-CoA kinase
MGVLIGLTGGIGSGKSTVAAILADLGAVVIDADRIAHEIYAPGTRGFDAVVERFGRDIVGEDGAVDRARLGAIVFGNRKLLQELNEIIHPLVRAEVAGRVAAAWNEDEDAVVVVEAALMTETGWTGGAGELWVVITDPRIASDRLVHVRGMEPEEVKLRMAAQTDNATRRLGATRVIENDGTPEELENAVREAGVAMNDEFGRDSGF